MTISETARVAPATASDGPTSPQPRRATRPQRGDTARQLVVYAFLLVAVAATMVPFVWMVLSSFKTQGEILRNPMGFLPEHPGWGNYVRWFKDFHIQKFFLNSLIVAVATVLGNLLFCSMVGYALAKLEFPGKRLLFALVMITLMVPGVVTFVPLFVTISKLGMVNTYPALFLPFLTGPLGVFLMRQFMLGIPNELIEAAKLDGANELRIFARIVMPLCGPPLATLGILTFLFSWNNFLWPLVAAQSEDKYTLPVALSLYSTGQNATNYALLLAGSVLVIGPIVLVFICLQRFFTQSVAMSGIK
jgi:multiple sugar transport system permease protein